MFRIVNDMGFQIKLDNGYTVSVMFSSNHYCSNRDSNRIGGDLESRNAETAVMDTFTGKFLPMPPDDCDDVQGYQTVKDLIALINEVRDFPNTDSKMAEVKELAKPVVKQLLEDTKAFKMLEADGYFDSIEGSN